MIAVGVGLAVAGRRTDIWLWVAGLTLIALGLFRERMRGVKAGPSGIELAIAEALSSPVAQLATPSQPPDLKLLISTGIPVGMAEKIMGTDHVIQLTAVNTSDRPLGVSSLGLGLSDGRYIPAIETLPTEGNVKLSAVLQPQQTATVWLDHGSTRDTLAREGVRIKEVVANMADGTRRREAVPDDWRKLGEPE